MRIVRLTEQADREHLMAAIDTIFFDASGVQAFADAADRVAFRHRWLGLYLESWPEHVHLARDRDGTLAGYLVGCLVDPARDERFAGIGYLQAFAAQCAAFPAHLHINLDPAYRSRGLGGQLIDAFATEAARAGAPGMHIVTSRTARNVGFYRAQGFAIEAEAPWKGGDVVFMGRGLAT